MFTGIVEELGRIKTIEPKSKGIRYTIAAQVVMDDLKTGDSISVNGACLTIVEKEKDSFCMDLVEETLNKSNLGELTKGDYVNLERAMKASGTCGNSWYNPGKGDSGRRSEPHGWIRSGMDAVLYSKRIHYPGWCISYNCRDQWKYC